MVEGVVLVMPRLMTHRGEGLEEEINEGGEEYRAVIGGRTVEDWAAMLQFQPTVVEDCVKLQNSQVS